MAVLVVVKMVRMYVLCVYGEGTLANHLLDHMLASWYCIVAVTKVRFNAHKVVHSSCVSVEPSTSVARVTQLEWLTPCICY